MQDSSSDPSAIVLAEFAEMLTRCEAAGVPRESARRSLAGMLALESLTAWSNEERLRQAALALTPARQALKKAFEMYQANEELRRLQIKPDVAEFDSICQAYLVCAYHAAPGDTLEIHGWVKPRTVRLTAFRLSFSNAEEATDAFMWFEGDSIRNCPPGRASSAHGCPVGTAVYKVT